MRPSHAAVRFVATVVFGLALGRGGSSVASAEDPRVWTDASGSFRRTAAFVRLEDKLVFLRLEDGSERKIPLDKLSKADQDYATAAAARLGSSDPFEVVAGARAAPPPAEPAASSGDSSSAADPSIRIVTVEGVGVDPASAKTDAYREAVRQVVGAFVDSSSLVANDQLIEDKVITLSSAFVEKAEPIKEAQDGGLVRVRLRAHVRVNKLLDSLRANKISTLKVDSESLVSQAVTKADQVAGMKELVKKLLPRLQRTCLRASAEGKPEIKTASGDDAELVFWLRIRPQLDAYLALAAKLDAAFSAAERPGGELVSPGTSLCDGKDYREYVKNWKSRVAEYRLPDIFVSDAERKSIAKSLDDNGNSSLLKYEPLYVFSEATASWNGAGLLRMRQVWDQHTRTQGETIVFLLVHSNETGARTRWKWFRLSPEEADVVISCLNQTTKATAVLRNKDGDEVARDVVLLQSVGMRPLVDKKVFAIAPFFMFDDLNEYIPSIEVQRSVQLTKSEVATVERIEAFIAAE